MSVPDTHVVRVRRWVADRNEEFGEHSDEVRVEMDVDARAVTILECRSRWCEDFGPEWTGQEIARLRYTTPTGDWTLYWPDRNSRFHLCEDFDSTPMVARLPAEINADPICIFWG